MTEVIKPDQETIDNLKAENRELQEQVNSLRSGMDEMLNGLDDQKEKYDTLIALLTKMGVNFKGIKEEVSNLVEE